MLTIFNNFKSSFTDDMGVVMMNQMIKVIWQTALVCMQLATAA